MNANIIMREIKALASRDSRLSINELRIIIALERAVARLERDSFLAKHLVFKGGLVLLKSFESLRFTRDADALAIGLSKETLRSLVFKALSADLEDGLWFGNTKLVELDEQGQYGAYRFDSAFQIGPVDQAKIHKLPRIHIDIGFSDILLVPPTKQLMPSLLGEDTPISWLIYPVEYIVAEKLETLFERGSANSRAKDVYDLVFLLPRCRDDNKLKNAIQQTFRNRGLPLPASLKATADQFDKTVLKNAWPGVKILEAKTEFESVWQPLLSYFEKLDIILSR